MGFLLFISLVDLFIVESGELLFIFPLFFTSVFFEYLGALMFDIYICNELLLAKGNRMTMSKEIPIGTSETSQVTKLYYK